MRSWGCHLHDAGPYVLSPELLSAKPRADLKLQGQYMGYMRQLKPKQKARVKAVREKKGYRAAIALGRKLAAPRG